MSLITCVCISQTDSHDVKIGDSVVGHHQLVDAVGWAGSNPGSQYLGAINPSVTILEFFHLMGSHEDSEL